MDNKSPKPLGQSQSGSTEPSTPEVQPKASSRPSRNQAHALAKALEETAELDDDPSALETALKLRSGFPAYGAGPGEDNADTWNRIAATQSMNTTWGWAMFSMEPDARSKALDEHHAKLVAQGVDHMVASAFVLTAPLLAENVAISRYIVATDNLGLRGVLPEITSISEAVYLAEMEYRLDGSAQSSLKLLLEERFPDLKSDKVDPCQTCSPLSPSICGHSVANAGLVSDMTGLNESQPNIVAKIQTNATEAVSLIRRKRSVAQVYWAFGALFVASLAAIVAAYSYNPWVDAFVDWGRHIGLVDALRASAGLTLSCLGALLLAFWGTKDEESFRVATLAYCYTFPFLVVLLFLPIDQNWGVLNFALLAGSWIANIACAWYVLGWFWAQGALGRADSRPWANNN